MSKDKNIKLEKYNQFVMLILVLHLIAFSHEMLSYLFYYVLN